MDLNTINEIKLLLSKNNETSYRASKIIFSLVNTSPNIFLDYLNEFKLILFSCCSTSKPQWGTVSLIILGICKAVNLKTSFFDELMFDLIEISYDITCAFQRSPSDSQFFCPDLTPISEVLKKKLLNGSASASLISTIAHHSSIGFLPNSSLIELITSNFEGNIITLSKSSEISIFFPDLLKPISSNEEIISLLFLTVSAFVFRRLTTDILTLIRYISDISATLMRLSQSNSNFTFLSLFFLGQIRANSEERILLNNSLLDQEKNLKKNLFTLIAPIKKKEIEIPIQQHIPKYIAHFSDVFIFQSSGLFKTKKWVFHYLSLLEEVQLLMWSENKNTNKDGMVLNFKDIKEVILYPANETESGKKNLIKIIYNKGDNLISFETYQEAMQWNNLFKQHFKSK